MLKQSVRKVLLASGTILWLAGCGNPFGGDDDADDAATTSAVTDVDSSVVTASDSELALSGKLSLIPPESSSSLRLAGTYDSDEENIFVEEVSMSALAQAETIMCYVAQTRFETQVNKGPYYAIVDNAQCETKQHSDTEGESLTNMKVRATREENKPIRVEAWIHEEDQGMQQTIHVEVKVAEGPSDTNPIGVFEMGFQFSNTATGEKLGAGRIASKRNTDGTLELLYVMSQMREEQGEVMEMYEGVIGNLDVTDGAISGGRINTKFDYGKWQKGEFKVAFDDKLLKREGKTQSFDHQAGGLGAEQDASGCLNRESYVSHVFRYGVYGADGNVKKLNSGMQIEAEVDGKKRRGNLGYHGLWLEGNGKLTNGQKIKKVEWVSGERKETEYTIVQAPGKLYKYSEKKIKLKDLAKAEMQVWDNSTNKSYLVKFDSAGKKFTKVSEVVMNPNGPPTYTAASGDVAMPEWGLRLQVNDLDANINIRPDAVLSDDLELRYHSRTLVSGSQDTDLDLQCFSRCPKLNPGSSSGGPGEFGMQSRTDGKQEFQVRVSDGAMVTYKFKKDTRNLYDATGTTAFQAPTEGSGGMAWINSGVLLTAAQLATIPTTERNISPWDLEGRVKEYYSWESSSESHGQFYGAKDANGAFVKFDRPMEFSYTHSQTNDYDGKADSPNYGKLIRLEYGGPGEVWGIPWKQSDDGGESKPIFSIKSGTEIKDGAGVAYKLKALEVAQNPSKVDIGTCAGLDVSGVPPLPTKDDLKEFTLDEEPADTDSPTRVEAGVLVE